MNLAKYEQLQEVSLLMQDIFKTKMQETYSQLGQTNFLEDISLKNLQKRFLNNSKFFLHVENKIILGVLELEPPSHIAFLFVKKEGFKIATSLCKQVQESLKEDFLTVGAYSDAVGFYKKLNFIIIDTEKTNNEINFTLMAKKIN